MYTYMHAITVKKETEFQGELGEVYGKVQREEREGRNVVIKLISQK